MKLVHVAVVILSLLTVLLFLIPSLRNVRRIKGIYSSPSLMNSR